MAKIRGEIISSSMSVSVIGLIGAADEIDRVSKFDNSLSFGAKQKSLGQIFFAL